MDHIMKSLLDIERKAKNMTKKVLLDYENMETIINNKAAPLVVDIETDADEEIKKYISESERDLGLQIEYLQNQKNEMVDFMEKEYEKSHELWEEQIINEILS